MRVARAALKGTDFTKLLLPVFLLLAFLSVKRILGSTYTLDVSNKLQDFITLSLSIFVEAFPFLVLGSLLAAVVTTYVPHAAFIKVLPRNSFLRRGVLSLLGFLFPVCECGNVPLSRAFMVQGFKPSEAMTFLLAAPVINPVTIWATWAAFGYDGAIVVTRVVATLVIANLVGLILSRHPNQRAFLNEDFAAICDAPVPSGEKPARDNRFKLGKLTELFTHEAYVMVKMLAFGVLIAGTVQTFVPRDLLVGIGSNVILSITAMLLLAFVVSICANVDAFFALSFANTFTAGSIVSFLVFGPMVDIKMLALLKTTFKPKLLLFITLLIVVLSFLTGVLFTYAL